MKTWKRAARVAALIAIAGCTADGGGIAGPSADPAHTISDAAHAGGVPGFYFLPPMVPAPAYAGSFDAGLAPRVEICALADTVCAALTAEFADVPVAPGSEHYAVNWHAGDYALDPAVTYRISVYVGTLRLGFADVDVVSTGRELKNVDTGEYIALLDSRTLPIKFRIETGIVGLVTLSPAADTVAVGGTAQFTATLADLHGNPLPGPAVAWSTSDPAVATIDGDGLATGVAPGTVTVTASVGYLSGTASLTVEQPNEPPVAAADTFDAIGNFTSPVAAPGVLANDTDPDADALSAVPGTIATVNGGTVTLAADGGFTYLSAAGFTGEDSFSYVATDGIDSVTAAVTMSVPTRVWYADNAAAAPGDGRDASPFAALADAQAASAPGETVFVRYGDGTGTGYDAGFVFQDGQTLTGQGIASDATAMLNGQSVVLLPAGGTPTITRGSPGATIALAQNVTLQGVRIESTAGAGITGGNFGTFTAGTVSVAATGGPALDLADGTAAAGFGALSSAASASAGLRLVGVSGTLSAPAGSISGSAGAGVEIAGGDAAVTYGGDVAVVGPRPVSVTGRTGGSVTLSGALASTGDGILVQGNTGGTIAFTGASKTLSTGANTAVALATNAGASIAFGGGGLVLSTTTGAGFDASGGGTVTVTGAGNTVSSAGGVAVRVVSTTIGASGLTFRRVSATGGPNGIVLQSTGALNGLQVTGSGGDCNRAAPTCSGGTLAGITGPDGGVAGSGVYLDGARNVVLTRMRFTGASNFAIRGTDVAGFTGEALLVDGVFGTSAAAEEAAIAFDGLSGAAVLRESYVGGGATDNLRVRNAGAGVLDRLVLDADTFGLNHALTGEDGVSVSAAGGTMNVTVQGSRFLGSRGQQFSLGLSGTASADLVFAGNALAGGHPATVSGAGNVAINLAQSAGDAVSLTYQVAGNTVLGAKGAAIAVAKGVGGASVSGSITGNTVGDPGVANSGSAAGAGISVVHAARGSHRTRIHDNRVHQYSGVSGIYVQTGGVAGGINDGVVHATITANTVSHPGTNNPGSIIDGLHLEVGTNSGDQYTLCANVGQGGANDLAAGGRAAEGGAPFVVIANAGGSSPVLKLAGYPAVTDVGTAAHANIESTLQSLNVTGGNAGYEETPSATTTYAGNGAVGAACDLP